MRQLFWAAVRRLVRWRLSHAARQVLIARRLQMTDGLYERWLERDIENFLATLDRVSIELRPIAHLHTLPTIGNRLMVELAVHTAAAYGAFLDCGLTESEARRTLADVGWLVYSEMLRLSSLPFRLITRDSGKRIRWTIRLLLRFPFNAPGAPGYEVEAHRKGDDLVTNWTRCPPQSFVRNLIAETDDRGDLEAFYQSWCLYDWPGADLIAGDGQRGHYKRRQTLSRGDPVCDMCWKAQSGNGKKVGSVIGR